VKEKSCNKFDGSTLNLHILMLINPENNSLRHNHGNPYMVLNEEEPDQQSLDDVLRCDLGTT
jgi:hypothetical protein